MMTHVDPIPHDRPQVVPYLCVRGAADAIAFYQRAFGAAEKDRMESPDGRILHPEIEIGGHLLFLADDFPEMNDGKESSPAGLGGTTVTMHRYVEDCDSTIASAVDAGAEVVFPATDMFWGDGFGKIRDPFGHEWTLATDVRDVSAEEMAAAAAEMFAGD
jgi:PhnB protein